MVFPEASVSKLIRRAVEASNSVAKEFIVDAVHANSIIIQVEVTREIAEVKLEVIFAKSSIPACFEIVDNDSKMTNVLAF